ncbi:unnamed protein product [Ranitomeya imitator]|uniref:Uncharacterized protein n=1 Tax=Ranitomeya imitator TaxID=111125 RepID=A0ABN9LLI7_9NEOB|nr:unnamed protein product [Ranitomeya imitator]
MDYLGEMAFMDPTGGKEKKVIKDILVFLGPLGSQVCQAPLDCRKVYLEILVSLEQLDGQVSLDLGEHQVSTDFPACQGQVVQKVYLVALVLLVPLVNVELKVNVGNHWGSLELQDPEGSEVHQGHQVQEDSMDIPVMLDSLELQEALD